MPTRGLNFDILPTCDSYRYYAVTHLSLSCYSNTKYVKNKSPNRSKHSHSNLEHEEHTQKSENLQEVEPKHISSNWLGFSLLFFFFLVCPRERHIALRASASGNFNSTLFYHSKKLLYHYNIPFYNTSTSQTFISLFYSLK